MANCTKVKVKEVESDGELADINAVIANTGKLYTL